jgi:GTP pyrophosphokinase
MVLPMGATRVDFAFTIHTDVGHQCVGARVNGRMVPLRTKLKNGDIVEVLTNAGTKPSRDWLNFVGTSRARNKIKHLIQEEEKTRAVELGRKVFEKDARRYDLNATKLLEGDKLAAVAAEFGAQKVEDLLAQIGYGKVSAKQVLDKLVPQEQLKEKPAEHPVLSAVKRVLSPGSAGADRIKVSGADELMVFRARCCNPIRGEKIVGYITRGKGVSVHSANCPNVVNLQFDPERRIDVEWDKGSDQAPYTVRLTMAVEDRKGMLAALSARVAEINTNITNLEATTSDSAHATIGMTVEIKDMKHLEKVIKSLRGVQGVLDVERAPNRS